ncbi:MAG: hypothetical protein MUO76_14900 [Anaerolineaceae bacterium]|nr:hypothetical protein [Anaerolineaceae bacterium]
MILVVPSRLRRRPFKLTWKLKCNPLIMHKLNHESIAYTKGYLGITNDELQ